MLRDLISRYNSDGGGKMQQMERDLEDVADITQNALAKVIERGERIDSLLDKTAALKSESVSFRTNAKRYNDDLWWRDQRGRMLLGIVAMAVIVVITFLSVHQNEHVAAERTSSRLGYGQRFHGLVMDRTNCLTIGSLSTQAGEACRAALSTCFGIGQRLLHGFEAEPAEAKETETEMAEAEEAEAEETPGSREVRVWRSMKGLTSQSQLAFEDLSPAGGEQQPESGSSGDSSCEVQEILEPETHGTLPKEGTASSETEPADTGTGTESDTALPEDVALLEEPYSASEGSERLSTDTAAPVNAVDMGRSLLELLRTGAAAKQTDTSAVEETQLICQATLEKKTEEPDEFSSPLPLPHIAGLSSALWESLVWPLMDPRHPKAFVGHDAFRGCSHMPTGLRPQVLVDERKTYQIMAMFKPSGWATCSTPQWEGLEGNLIRHVWCYFNAPTAAPCHRLDKGTSGIVLVGTNKTASKHICQQILNKGIVKQYVGLCHGMVEPGMGVFSAPLALSRADRPLGACSTEGREAVTRFRVLGYFHGAWGSFSLLQVQIEHGRQHQIRPLAAFPKPPASQRSAMALTDDLFQAVVPEDVAKLGLVFTSLPPGHIEVKSVSSGSWAAEQEILPGDSLVRAQGRDLEQVSDDDFRDITQQRPLTLVFVASDSDVQAKRLARIAAEAQEAKAKAAKAEVAKAETAKAAAAKAAAAKAAAAKAAASQAEAAKAEAAKAEAAKAAAAKAEAAKSEAAKAAAAEAAKAETAKAETARAEAAKAAAAEAAKAEAAKAAATKAEATKAAAKAEATASDTPLSQPQTPPAQPQTKAESKVTKPEAKASVEAPAATEAPALASESSEVPVKQGHDDHLSPDPPTKPVPTSTTLAADPPAKPSKLTTSSASQKGTLNASPAEATAKVSADDSVTPALAPSLPRNKEVDPEPVSQNTLRSQSGSQAKATELKPGGAGPRAAAKVSERHQEADVQAVDASLYRPTPEVGNVHEAMPKRQAARMSDPEPSATPASFREPIKPGGHGLEEELAESRAELQTAHAERAKLRDEARSAQGLIKRLRSELADAQVRTRAPTRQSHQSQAEAEGASLPRLDELRQELDEARGELARQKMHGSGPRESLLKTELGELEATMKKVKADLQRSQQAVRNCEAEMMSEAEGGGGSGSGSLPLRMEQAVARGLQRQLVEGTVSASYKASQSQENEIESVRTELRIEKAAMRSFHRTAGSDIESTVQQAVQQREDLKQSLVRAENAAVRGLRRRSDEARRMTLQLEDPLVQEANAIRSTIPQQEEMEEFLSGQLRNLEEATAAMVEGDLGRDAFQLVAKAQGFDFAETTAARALAEEAKALAHAEEARKELHDSDLYAARVELHKERTLRLRAVDENTELLQRLSGASPPSVTGQAQSQPLHQSPQALLAQADVQPQPLQAIQAPPDPQAQHRAEPPDSLRASSLPGAADLSDGPVMEALPRPTETEPGLRQIADDLDKVQIALLSISGDWHGESMMPKLRSPLRSDQTADPQLLQEQDPPVPDMQEEVNRLEAQIQLQSEKLSEQQGTFQEVLDSTELLGEAALQSEQQAQQLEEELLGVRLAFQLQSEELAEVAVSEVRDSSARRSEKQEGSKGQTEKRPGRSSSPTVGASESEESGRPGRQRQLTPGRRPLPPRSPSITVGSVAQGSARPPRSPPAVTGRSTSPLPLPSPSFGFPGFSDILGDDPSNLPSPSEAVHRPDEAMLPSRRASPQFSVGSPFSEADPVEGFSRPSRAELEDSLADLEAAVSQMEAKYAELEQSVSQAETEAQEAQEAAEALQRSHAEGRRSLMEGRHEGLQMRQAASAHAPPAPPPPAPAEATGPNPRTVELHAEILAQMQEEEKRWRKRLQVERRKAAAAALRAVAEESSEQEAGLRQQLQRAVERGHQLEEELLQRGLSSSAWAGDELSNAAPAVMDGKVAAKEESMKVVLIEDSADHTEASNSKVEDLEVQVEQLKKEVTELPRLRSLLEAAEKRLSKEDESQVELEKIRRALRDENQMAVLSAVQGAKDTEDMLRTALAAEATCQLMAESEAERAEAATGEARLLLQDLMDASRSELLALRAWMEEEAQDSSGRLGEAQQALHLAGEGEAALVKLGEEEVSAAEARAELSQEQATRALELQAAGWFYFAETEGWSEGEAAEAQLMHASRQEEACLLDQRDASIHAATTEASALRAEAAAMRKEALGLRHDLSKEEVAFEQMKLVADRARAAESATLRSALTEVRAEAARGASIMHRAEDAEKELRRLRHDQAQKEAHLKDLTDQLFDAERRATVAVSAMGTPLAITNDARRERLGRTFDRGPGQGPVPSLPVPSSGHAGPVGDASGAGAAGTSDGLGDKAAMLRARAEGLKGEVERWQAARNSQSSRRFGDPEHYQQRAKLARILKTMKSAASPRRDPGLHMASLGHPIVADARYNPHKAKDDAEICPRLFLHACYLRCTLLSMDSMESEKKEDPFAVACHLPPELRRVLLHELSLDRTSSARLPESARQLCEVLLHPEESHGHGNRHSIQRRADMDELHESRLTLRRRDEFMRRFHFNSKERTEIIRILGQLKTSKERSAALQQFRVLGQRTPDFIVGRFAKYVDGLLRWSPCKNGSTGEDELAPDMCAACKAKVPEAPEAEAPCAESTAAPEQLTEMPQVSGPLQILTESVWCDVCGEVEKQVSVQAPSLELRMRLPGINGRRPPCQPVRRRRNTRDFRTTWKVKNSGKRAAEEHEDEELEEDCEEEDDDNDDDEDDAVDDDDEAEDDDEEEQLEEVSSYRTRRWQPAGYKAKEPAAADAQAQVQDLQRTVRDLVEGRGGSVDGVWLAGKVAPSFNMYVRENTRRNDGSLKKWLMSIPGIEVETDTHQSQWRVKLA
ncbi:ylyB [Symbiodinium sp. CCMP2456]|nr:ylyB [Symbiodinium sp. CCMP2456]